MARLRYNGLTATLGADLLTAGTTITFTGALTHAAGTVPTITGTDYIPLSIVADDGTVLEIMHLTAYATGASSGTVLRAQESTTATDHGEGLRVVHGITVADTTEFTGGGGGASAFVGARVYATASQPVASGAWVPVNFGNESFDTNAFHDNATNNHRFTIPTGMGGKYRVLATASFAINTTGTRHISFIRNGTSRYAPMTYISAGGAFRTRAQTEDVIELAAGDYVHVEVYHDAGTGLEVGDTTASGSVGETWAVLTYLGT